MAKPPIHTIDISRRNQQWEILRKKRKFLRTAYYDSKTNTYRYHNIRINSN